jgi:hypothetical protein
MRGGVHVRRRRGSPRRALLATLAVCGALFVPAACGGSSISADQQNEIQVQKDITAAATAIAVPGQIACNGPRCRLATTYAFHSTTEASFVALPIVFWINADDHLNSVKTIALKITNWATNTTAAFACRLRRPSRSGTFGVASLHRMCTTAIAAAS